MLNMFILLIMFTQKQINLAASLLARWLPQQMDLHIWSRADFILFFLNQMLFLQKRVSLVLEIFAHAYQSQQYD